MDFQELKFNIINIGNECHFFDHETLKFFGENYSSMHVLKTKGVIKDLFGEVHVCYILSVTRTKNAFGRCKPYTIRHYFDDHTFTHITSK